MADNKDSNVLVDNYKKMSEKADMFAKNSNMAAISTIAHTYDKVGKDVRKFNDIKTSELEKILVEAHEVHHGGLLQREHGFDYKSLKGIPDHKKIETYDVLFDSKIKELRDTIIRDGADFNANQAIDEARTRGLQNAVRAGSHYFTNLGKDDQMKLVNDTLLKGIDMKNYNFNKGLLDANPDAVGSAVAQVGLGYTTAKNASKTYLTKKEPVANTYKPAA